MVNGKAKGKDYERKIANFLSDFFGLNFQRVPNSGAFIGGKNAYRISQLSDEQILLAKGDIIPPTELKDLIIECKSRKEFAFHQLLKGENKELNSWIEQVLVDYNACDKVGEWVIIFKPNGKGDYVCWNTDKFKSHSSYINYNYKKENFTVCRFDNEWLELNKEALLNVCKCN